MFNFKELPTTSQGVNPIGEGFRGLVISKIEHVITTSKNEAIKLTINPYDDNNKLLTKFNMLHTIALLDPNKEPLQFGQYALQRLLVVTNTVPEGDFDIPYLVKVLKNKTFGAPLISKEFNGKDQLQLDYPEKWTPWEVPAQTVNPTVVASPSPAPVQKPQTVPVTPIVTITEDKDVSF